MARLFLQSYFKLMYFDRYLARGNFRGIYQAVRDYPIAKRNAAFSHDGTNLQCG